MKGTPRKGADIEVSPSETEESEGEEQSTIAGKQRNDTFKTELGRLLRERNALASALFDKPPISVPE